jgi:hypothetical protein
VLRQLARLTRRVPAAGARVCALSVYANDEDTALAARDRGFEGVACVDDSARAVVLLFDLYREVGDARLLEWAKGLLDFVLYMQRDDGRFHNFIRDWDGTINVDGPTSYAGGTFWQARAVRALAKAHLALRDERVGLPLAQGFAFATEHDAPPDVRAIHVLAAIDLTRAGLTPVLRETLERWCDEIAECRDGDVLRNAPAEPAPPHLWGHLQEGALAEAAMILDRPDLLEVARRSAQAFLAPHIERAFPEPTVQPYGVASAVFAMDRLHQVTSEVAYARWREYARAWFDGRNSAEKPVYDRESGRVADGIDDGRINAHSGAESNIVGAQALLPEVAARAREMLDAVSDRLESVVEGAAA